jgi:N-acetylglutamate synthase-like GNAT family acetyltransferase
MDFKTITIRSAGAKNIEGIWHLLHANSMGWSREKIKENIDRLLVMEEGERLLAILYGELNSYHKEVFWVAVHPLHPEEPLKQMLIGSLQRNPGRTQKKLLDFQIICCP